MRFSYQCAIGKKLHIVSFANISHAMQYSCINQRELETSSCDHIIKNGTVIVCSQVEPEDRTHRNLIRDNGTRPQLGADFVRPDRVKVTQTYVRDDSLRLEILQVA